MIVSPAFILTNIYLFSSKKNFYLKLIIINIIFTIFIQIGYAFKFSSIILSNSDIFLLYLFIYLLRTNKINYKNVLYIVFLLNSVFLGYFITYIKFNDYKILPLKGDYDLQFIYKNQLDIINFGLDNILRISIFIIFIFTVSLFKIRKNLKKEIKKILFKIGIIQICYLFMELALKKLFIYKQIIGYLPRIFGNAGMYKFEKEWIRDDKIWLQGLTLEPGYLSFGIFIYLLCINKNKNRIYFEIIGYVALLLNKSLSSFVIFGIYILIRLNENKKKIIVFFSCLLILLYFIDITPYLNRIEHILDGEMKISSENIRRETIKTAFIDLYNNPFFGYGLGNTRCVSFFTSIFLNLGVIGTFIWVKFVKNNFYNGNINNFFIVCILFLAIGSIENIYNLYIPIILLLISERKK